MLIEITNKFRKQVEKLNNKRVNNSLNKVVQELSSAPNLRKINNLKKLKGHKNFYRIRMGDYRIGIVVNSKTIILATFDHRSDIYKYFP